MPDARHHYEWRVIRAEFRELRRKSGKDIDTICKELNWPLSRLLRMEQQTMPAHEADILELMNYYGEKKKRGPRRK
jgi:hypothetical protein